MRGLIAKRPLEDMPSSYEKIQLEIACNGIEHENYINILTSKINVLGGMNFISVENINKANANRTENFNNFIETCYPYIKLNKPKEKKTRSMDELIEEYKKIFPTANKK